jgi:hypothetical protein
MKKYINFNPLTKNPAAEYFGKIFPGKHFSEKSYSHPKHLKTAQNMAPAPAAGAPVVGQAQPNLLPQMRPPQVNDINQLAAGGQFQIEPPRLPHPEGWDLGKFHDFARQHIGEDKTFMTLATLNTQLSEHIKAVEPLTPPALGEAFLSTIKRNLDAISELQVGLLRAEPAGNAPEGWNISIFRVVNPMTSREANEILKGYQALYRIAQTGQINPEDMTSLQWALRTYALAPVMIGPFAAVMNIPAFLILQLALSNNPQFRGYASHVIEANIAALEAIIAKQFRGHPG